MTEHAIVRLLWMTSVIGCCVLQVSLSLFRSGDSAFPLRLLLLCGSLGLLVWISRASTPAAALTGAVLAASITSGTAANYDALLWRSALPGLLTMLMLTLMATRFRRSEKVSLGLAESRKGRSTSQVIANLGAAALFASFATVVSPSTHLHSALLAAVVAALAEAAADTLASELGEIFHGRVVMLTTWREVPAGTDGGVTVKGSVAGFLGALAVVLVCAAAMRLTIKTVVAALAAAIAGLFIDSLLGATLETRRYLGNNGVNFLSTLAAALIAAALVSI